MVMVLCHAMDHLVVIIVMALEYSTTTMLPVAACVGGTPTVDSIPHSLTTIGGCAGILILLVYGVGVRSTATRSMHG